MELVKVKTKYQVTIPKDVRDRIGVEKGDVLDVRVDNGTVVLVPQEVRDRVSKSDK